MASRPWIQLCAAHIMASPSHEPRAVQQGRKEQQQRRVGGGSFFENASDNNDSDITDSDEGRVIYFVRFALQLCGLKSGYQMNKNDARSRK